MSIVASNSWNPRGLSRLVQVLLSHLLSLDLSPILATVIQYISHNFRIVVLLSVNAEFIYLLVGRTMFPHLPASI